MQEFLSIGQSSVSESFSRLTRRNAVDRSPESAHGYVLTPGGMKLLAQGDDAVEKAVRLAFDGVPADLYLANSVGALLNMAPFGRIRMKDRGYFLEFSLFECTLLAEVKCIEASRRHGLSLVEYRIMLVLCEADGLVGMGDLAAKLELSLAHVSEACTALIGKGLCDRADDPLDGRRRRILLTPEGVDLVQAVTPDVAASLYEVTANRLSRKEQDAAFMLSKF